MSAFANTIFIVNDISKALEDITSKLPLHSYRVIRNQDLQKDEFQINEANLAIKEAYLASNSQKFVILCGKTFRIEAQNSLLKILEESPPNIVFFLLTESKTSILPTIFSRLYVRYLKTNQPKSPTGLNLAKMDLKTIFTFVKNNQKISKFEAKEFVQSLCLEISKTKISLNEKELGLFNKSIRLLELNSRPNSVLATLLMTLFYLKDKK